ncbi:hypothetical protein VitviT2T_018706 [Vitis vinifera]|uniref:Uncharacterized protein n=1 Tax=Vitis vinifera TaxID=29760 RepID=A0ABY9D057_VITVI|nr:hypothetical protein VitviT2T_018706 [Vitis vinifera]
MEVTVLRNGTRVPKPASQLRNTLRNGALAAKLEVFTLWDFAAVSQLRNEVHCAAKWHSCAKMCFACKYPAEWDFWCEIRLFLFAMRFAAAKQMALCCEVALVCQNGFRSCENFRRDFYSVAEWFGNKMPISQRLQNLADPCFSPVFAPFDSDFAPIFFSSISLQFLLILIIQKPILHQNKLELKH